MNDKGSQFTVPGSELVEKAYGLDCYIFESILLTVNPKKDE